MGYAYRRDGLEYRGWDKPNDLAPDEVYFTTLPSEAELRAAFPNYDTAKQLNDLLMATRSALFGDITIVCQSNPSINGTYSVSNDMQRRIHGLTTFITITGKFPNNVASFPLQDKSGNLHMFDSTELFLAFAAAYADYIASLEMILATGIGPLPSSIVSI